MDERSKKNLAHQEMIKWGVGLVVSLVVLGVCILAQGAL